jgi:hypothetical protein
LDEAERMAIREREARREANLEEKKESQRSS